MYARYYISYEFNNLIKYGPLDPQTFFIQGWIHDDIGQHIQDLFGEDWIDRFLRLGTLYYITYIQFKASPNRFLTIHFQQ